MKQYQASIRQLLLLVTPLLASSVLATSPSQAATFAFSQGVLEFKNFSQSPSRTLTDFDTNTITNGNASKVNAVAGANANFIVTPAKAFNVSLSQAFGKNKPYFGLAESEAKVIGSFVIEAFTPFSFDFTSAFELETFIDFPETENATASGDITFVLLDTANLKIFDFFKLAGNLTTEGGRDFIVVQKSENVTLSESFTESDFAGKQESATAFVQGSVQRSFANKTNLALLAVKRNQARVTAPEPSTSLALIFSFGVIGVVLKGKRKVNTKLTHRKRR